MKSDNGPLILLLTFLRCAWQCVTQLYESYSVLQCSVALLLLLWRGIIREWCSAQRRQGCVQLSRPEIPSTFTRALPSASWEDSPETVSRGPTSPGTPPCSSMPTKCAMKVSFVIVILVCCCVYIYIGETQTRAHCVTLWLCVCVCAGLARLAGRTFDQLIPWLRQIIARGGGAGTGTLKDLTTKLGRVDHYCPPWLVIERKKPTTGLLMSSQQSFILLIFSRYTTT